MFVYIFALCCCTDKCIKKIMRSPTCAILFQTCVRFIKKIMSTGLQWLFWKKTFEKAYLMQWIKCLQHAKSLDLSSSAFSFSGDARFIDLAMTLVLQNVLHCSLLSTTPLSVDSIFFLAENDLKEVL